MGTRGIENGGSKVMMQVDDHSVTELCARKNNELQQLLQTTFCKNGSVCYTFEIHSIDGSVLQLDGSGLMQAITPDVLEQCRALVQQYVAKGTCGRCKLRNT